MAALTSMRLKDLTFGKLWNAEEMNAEIAKARPDPSSVLPVQVRQHARGVVRHAGWEAACCWSLERNDVLCGSVLLISAP